MSLDDLRHQEEVTFGRGRVGNDIVGDLAVIDQILPLLHLHRGDRGHGLHTLDIDLRELLDKGEHGVELALQMRNLALGNRNARQMRDAADGSGVDGHYIRPLTAKPMCRIAEAAFAPQPAARSIQPALSSEPGPIWQDPASIRPPGPRGPGRLPARPRDW